MNPYLSTNAPDLSGGAHKLLNAVKTIISNSELSEFFMFNKRMMKLTGLDIVGVRSAQRELMRSGPTDLIEHGRLTLQTRFGGCLYTISPAEQ